MPPLDAKEEPEPSTPKSDASGPSQPLCEHLDSVAATVEASYDEYFDSVEATLSQLQSRAQSLLDPHDALRSDLSFARLLNHDDGSHSSSAVPSPTDALDAWESLWRQVCDYRERLRTDILAPLRATLDEIDLGSHLCDRRSALIERLEIAIDEVPKTVSRPEPENFYTSAPSDSVPTRLRKALKRVRRRSRDWMPIAEEAPSLQQEIPLRTVVRHHVRDRLVHVQRSHVNAVEDRLQGWVADLERVTFTLTHALLEFEQRIDRLDFHRTTDTAEPPRSRSTPARAAPDLAAALEVPQAPPSTEIVKTVKNAVDALHDSLERATTLSVADLRAEAATAVEQTRATLGDAARRPWPATASPNDVPSPQLRPWPSWTSEANARLSLCETMLSFYSDVETLRDDLIAKGTEAGPNRLRRQVSEALKHVDAHRRDVRDHLDEAVVDALSLPSLASRLDDAATAIEESLGPIRSSAPSLSEIVASAKQKIEKRIEALPSTLAVHPLPAPDAPPSPSASPRTVDVRSGAEVTFDLLFFDEIQAVCQRLEDLLETEMERAAQIPPILHYGREALLDEEPTASNGTSPSFDTVDDLARGSLKRVHQRLQRRHTRAEAAAAQWADALWTTFRHGLTRLHQQWDTENPFQDQVAQFTRQLARTAHDATSEAEEQVRHGWFRLRRWGLWAQRQLSRLVNTARRHLGLTSRSDQEVTASVETLATIGQSLERLPIVYRRLFSFEPVDDPDLFQGRQAARSFVERQVDRWRKGIPTSLLLIGTRGSGLTSLLNVIRATTLRNARLHHLRLDERPDTESQLALRIARTLNLNLPSLNGSLTLNEVAQAVQRSSAPDTPFPRPAQTALSSSPPSSRPIRACFVEHLEQLLLRTVGGLDLLNRFLTFVSRTDAHVLWIGTMSTAAWQLAEKRLPAATELITHAQVDPLSRDEMEAAIMSRHRRSGLDLSFAPASSTGPSAPASEPSERQQAFFDRLHEISHQNVALALLYWFRSVEPRSDGMGLRVCPIDPISFRVLDELTLQQEFALKSFLVHTSLTVDEYRRVAQIPQSDSLDIFESLGNASLIEPIDGPSRRPSGVYFEAVDPNEPYRISPLLVAPIINHLASDNIVH